MKSPNVVSYSGAVTRALREEQNGHPARVFWLTGLSGSGKSTLAHQVEEQLHRMGLHTYTFDGDNVRHGLCGDLSFSPEGRAENLRRIGEMVKLFLDAGVVCLTAFISPLEKDRKAIRKFFHQCTYVKYDQETGHNDQLFKSQCRNVLFSCDIKEQLEHDDLQHKKYENIRKSDHRRASFTGL